MHKSYSVQNISWKGIIWQQENLLHIYQHVSSGRQIPCQDKKINMREIMTDYKMFWQNMLLVCDSGERPKPDSDSAVTNKLKVLQQKHRWSRETLKWEDLKLPWKEHWRQKSTLQECHGNKLELYHRTEFDGEPLKQSFVPPTNYRIKRERISAIQSNYLTKFTGTRSPTTHLILIFWWNVDKLWRGRREIHFLSFGSSHCSKLVHVHVHRLWGICKKTSEVTLNRIEREHGKHVISEYIPSHFA